MKVKTADLTGPALDWAVAKSEGLNPNSDPKIRRQYVGYSGFAEANGFGYAIKHYSTDWSQGGPIIERKWIELGAYHDQWRAVFHGEEGSIHQDGPTPLIAAMRCIVASRLGDGVEVPDELM